MNMILHPDKRQFLHKCLDLLDNRGIKQEVLILGKHLDGILYEDNVILIAKSLDDLQMEIERKSNNNPIFYMENGMTIMFHGEYIYLEEHVNKLLRV